jgi:hypothetical protein
VARAVALTVGTIIFKTVLFIVSWGITFARAAKVLWAMDKYVVGEATFLALVCMEVEVWVVLTSMRIWKSGLCNWNGAR